MSSEGAQEPETNSSENPQSTAEEKVPETASSSASAENNKEDWQVQLESHKSLGDASFRSGNNFAEAILHYTHALSLDPTHHILLSNRSAAYLRNGEKSKALADAKECVKVQPPDFFKGHSRLAAALLSLGRHSQAIQEYQIVLKSDPSNKVAQEGLDTCRKMQQQQQQWEQQQLHGELARTQRQEEEEQKKEEDETKGGGGEAKKTFKSDDGGGEEDDLLADFFSEVETVAKQPKKRKIEQEKEAPTHKIKQQKRDLGSAESHMERLLAPKYQWRNLNPFFVLDVSHEATEEDISRQYKALSLLLHPDKNASPKAQQAYDEVQRAKLHLNDEVKRKHARDLVEQGLKLGKGEWERSSKRHNSGSSSSSSSLEEAQQKAVQRIFAEIEHKRREVERREQAQDLRERQQEEAELQKERDSRDFDKKWRQEDRVDGRVGNWRDFQKKK